MERDQLEARFARMGARLKVEDGEAPFRRVPAGSFTIDVQRDERGEYFEIRTRPGGELQFEVVDLQPAERHLLLLVRDGGRKQKLLCGHDERQWFVAGVPAEPGVASVQAAMEALKPAEVRQAQERRKLKPAERRQRKTAAYVRQGEWFFIPVPNLTVPERLVLRNEPLSRGAGSKPHMVELCYRTGGTSVYVCDRHPGGLNEAQYRRLLRKVPESQGWNWRVMRRDPRVYVKGRISHPDHKTIELREWHRVLMNTEGQSAVARNVAFLD